MTYEVRGAGSSVRLYTNGIFHSQWNSRHVLTGALWDLLTLPGFLLSTSLPLRVLVLGVGGGAVIRQQLALLNIEEIVGVELDDVHLQIARRWFGLSKFGNVSLRCADVRDWLEQYNGAGFDIVIDDLFGHAGAETERSVAIDRYWSGQLASVLSPEAVLITNTVSLGEQQAIKNVLKPVIDGADASTGNSKPRPRITAGYSLRHPLYDNQIMVLHRAVQTPVTRQWRKHWIEQIDTQITDATCVSLAKTHLQRASRWYSSWCPAGRGGAGL